jgi:hypothetical protein
MAERLRVNIPLLKTQEDMRHDIEQSASTYQIMFDSLAVPTLSTLKIVGDSIGDSMVLL